MVAESFKNLPIISNIFEEGGHQYVRVQLKSGTIRKVRWYKEKGGKNILEKTSAFELTPEKPANIKEILGFGSKGYITIFKGNTEATRDWFAQNGRYSKLFGWYFPSGKIYTTLPHEIEPIRVLWEEISEDNKMFSDEKILSIINTKINGESKSKFAGAVGDKLDINISVIYEKDIINPFGITHFHIFEDENGNKYSWTTNVKKLNTGEKYNITASIKELKIFKGEEQTVLTRCRIYNPNEDSNG